MYIGNAMHGNYAAVFAQLIVDGRPQGWSPQKTSGILFTITDNPRTGLCLAYKGFSTAFNFLNMHDDKIYQTFRFRTLICDQHNCVLSLEVVKLYSYLFFLTLT